MNGFVRVLMFIYSVVIAVISVVLLYALVDDGIFADILSENIALNSARAAQVGIKNARCRVTPGKNGAIRVIISCVLYSNVEIPASMAKAQEKVKKDIERYTGIVVQDVFVKVTKVEATTAKVENR